MADDEQPGKPGPKKWVLAVVLFAIAIFMAVSVGYKIITRGP